MLKKFIIILRRNIHKNLSVNSNKLNLKKIKFFYVIKLLLNFGFFNDKFNEHI